MQHKSALIEVENKGRYSTAVLFLDGCRAVEASAKDPEAARRFCLDGWQEELRRAEMSGEYPW